MTTLINHRITTLVILFLLLATISFAAAEDESIIFNSQGIAKANRGNYEEAIRAFEVACQKNPFNDNAYANLACAHNNMGVLLVNKKKFTEALDHFNIAKSQKPEDISVRLNLLSTLVILKKTDQAIQEITAIKKLRPNDPEVLLKLANAQIKLEKNFAALEILENLTEKFPNNAKYHKSLAKVLYNTGNSQEAIYHLKQATTINPSDKSTIQLLKKAKMEFSFSQKSQKFESEHFILTCSESFSVEWGEQLLEILENAYNDIGQTLHFFPEEKAQVTIFETNEFKRAHDLPNWAGGLYDGKIRIPVASKNTNPVYLKGAVLHEYTHHIVYLLSAGKCPVWLNEGLAQFFEFAEAQNRENNWNKGIAEYINALTLKKLENSFSKKTHRNIILKSYFASLMLVRALQAEYGWEAIRETLIQISKGHDFENSMKNIFKISEQEMRELALDKNYL
jgi:Flp pilus assembly protein TadD